MHHATITVRRISGALGAEVEGVDLSRGLDDETVGEVRRALLDHQVIFFRDQQLTPEQHIAFGRRFGELNIHDFVAGMAEYPEVIEIRKEPKDRMNFGGDWHTDVSYLERPALGSILYAKEAPAFGGDTMFASQYRAYETLSDGMKKVLEGLRAVHTADHVYGRRASYFRDGGSMRVSHAAEAESETMHPVVRVHPETGRKALYVNRVFTVRFDGMTAEESAPLLSYLFEHTVRPEFTCRFRWENGSIAFWDNRCVQHYALNDYHGQRRLMHRVTINGDRPV